MKNLPSIEVGAGLELREIPLSEAKQFLSVLILNREFFLRTESSMADISTDEEALKFLEKGDFAKSTGTGARFGLWRGPDLLGQFNIFDLDQIHRKAQVGYWLAEKENRKGYASKALKTLIGFGFEDLHLHRLEATTATTNQPSIRLLERVGFKREGLLREVFWTQGKFVDDYLYSILETD